MLHLTHTGVFAGRPLCGSPKNEADTYQHPAYSNEGLQRQLAHPDTCTGCVRAWRDSEAIDEAESAHYSDLGI